MFVTLDNAVYTGVGSLAFGEGTTEDGERVVFAAEVRYLADAWGEHLRNPEVGCDIEPWQVIVRGDVLVTLAGGAHGVAKRDLLMSGRAPAGLVE